MVDDVYCGIRSATHPRIAKRPTLEDFLAERHIAVEALAEHTNVDESLDSLGHTRDIALRISHFGALPGLVAQTSYLSIIPTSVAPEMCSQANIETFELPFAVPELQVSLHHLPTRAARSRGGVVSRRSSGRCATGRFADTTRTSSRLPRCGHGCACGVTRNFSPVARLT